MNEIYRYAVGMLAMFLVIFTAQSLPLILCRGVFYKILPAVMFYVPIRLITDMAWETGDLRGAAAEYCVILLPMVFGEILGWVAGLRFRKLLDDERGTGDPDRSDP